MQLGHTPDEKFMDKIHTNLCALHIQSIIMTIHK